MNAIVNACLAFLSLCRLLLGGCAVRVIMCAALQLRITFKRPPDGEAWTPLYTPADAIEMVYSVSAAPGYGLAYHSAW